MAVAPSMTPVPEMPAATPDMPVADTAGEPEVIATIARNPDGTLMLYRGDEPEEGAEMAEGAGETFDSPGALMRALMGVLDSGTAGAEESFGAGFRGEPDDVAAEPAAPMA